MLNHAKIKNNVLFVGLGKTFQIWEPKNFEKFKSEDNTNLNRVLIVIRIRHETTWANHVQVEVSLKSNGGLNQLMLQNYWVRYD